MKVSAVIRNQLLLLRESSRRNILGWLWKAGFIKIVSRADMADHPDIYQVHTFGQPHKFETTLPITLEEDKPPIVDEMAHQSVKLEAPFVAELHDVYLVSKLGICVGSHREIYMESVMSDSYQGSLYFESLPLHLLLERETTRLKTPEMDIACSLIHAWGRHTYAHWFMECLSRLEGLEYYEQITGQQVPILVHANLKSWQRDSLQLLGYGPDRYQTWDGPRLNVKKLILPSFRRQQHWSEPDAFEWLRNRLIQNLPAPTEKTPALSPRVFISRGDAVGRRIVNEAEVMELASTFGFVSYMPEALSFADEVRLFAQAEAIMGSHGSGLMNMIFSTQRPTIIDFYNIWFTESFYQMTSSLGFPYACLYCEPAPGADSGQKSGDVMVDIDKLKRLLHKLFPNG